MEENPFPELKISSSEFLDNLGGRSKCRKCQRSRKYYCYTCYMPVEEIKDRVPRLKLPVKIDIIKHPHEVDGKSTAVHAAVIAPDDVTVYTYPCIPDFEDKSKVVLLFPGKESVTLQHLAKMEGTVCKTSDMSNASSVKAAEASSPNPVYIEENHDSSSTTLTTNIDFTHQQHTPGPISDLSTEDLSLKRPPEESLNIRMPEAKALKVDNKLCNADKTDTCVESEESIRNKIDETKGDRLTDFLTCSGDLCLSTVDKIYNQNTDVREENKQIDLSGHKGGNIDSTGMSGGCISVADKCQKDCELKGKDTSGNGAHREALVSGCPFDRVVIVDSTWNQTKTICSDERLKGIQSVELKTRETKFWRHQKDIPNTYLSTIEAIYYFLRDYHDCFVQSKYGGEFDDLLFFFVFMYRKIRTLYDGGEQLQAYRSRKQKK